MASLDELKRLEAAATPGPWRVDQCGEVYTEAVTEWDEGAGCDLYKTLLNTSYYSDGNPNGALTAAMRNALPALLAVAEAARIPDEEQLVPDDDERAPGWVLVPRERLKALREALSALEAP